MELGLQAATAAIGRIAVPAALVYRHRWLLREGQGPRGQTPRLNEDWGRPPLESFWSPNNRSHGTGASSDRPAAYIDSCNAATEAYSGPSAAPLCALAPLPLMTRFAGVMVVLAMQGLPFCLVGGWKGSLPCPGDTRRAHGRPESGGNSDNERSAMANEVDNRRLLRAAP